MNYDKEQLIEDVESFARDCVRYNETRVLDAYFSWLYGGIREALDEFEDKLDDCGIDRKQLEESLVNKINDDCHISMRC